MTTKELQDYFYTRLLAELYRCMAELTATNGKDMQADLLVCLNFYLPMLAQATKLSFEQKLARARDQLPTAGQRP